MPSEVSLFQRLDPAHQRKVSRNLTLWVHSTFTELPILTRVQSMIITKVLCCIFTGMLFVQYWHSLVTHTCNFTLHDKLICDLLQNRRIGDVTITNILLFYHLKQMGLGVCTVTDQRRRHIAVRTSVTLGCASCATHFTKF